MSEIEEIWGRGAYHCLRQRSTKVHPGVVGDPKVLADVERPDVVQLEDPHQVLQLLVVHALQHNAVGRKSAGGLFRHCARLHGANLECEHCRPG